MPKFGYSINEVNTPAYALDLPIFRVELLWFCYVQENCHQMVKKAQDMNLKLRVHVKVNNNMYSAFLQNRLTKLQREVVSNLKEFLKKIRQLL